MSEETKDKECSPLRSSGDLQSTKTWTGCIKTTVQSVEDFQHFTAEERHKAGNSHLFQTGNFGTREGKNNRQGRKPMKFRTNDSKRWNSNEIKFQQFMRRFPFETPNEATTAHHRTCLDWNPATRLENRNQRAAEGGAIIAPPIASAL
ncbi:hypothetical protein AVEN_46156-1 [Araneus ventricosus]|uniref:Uncharacterized protein n=1 Tax=Araneus ventricosus TaxID=182803 RepID=A0A4Y2D7M4_ARAVE|nr:hypothetical protein AVEN_46156-1 [Araneus ventricosus]